MVLTQGVCGHDQRTGDKGNQEAHSEVQRLRSSHREQIERQAQFVREHPSEWKKPHTRFINAIFDKHAQFKERLLKLPGGKEKWAEIYGDKNKERYDKFK